MPSIPSIEYTALIDDLRHPPRDLCGGAAPPSDKVPAKRLIFDPLREAMLTQIVLVVESELLKAGTCHVRQLEFELFGSAACLTAFGDILHSRPRFLYHLIVGSAPSIYVLVTEGDREVIHQL